MAGLGKCELAAPHKQVVRATQRINVECASSGNIAGARALIEELILGRGLKPTLVTANVLIKTYRTARHPEGAEAVLREMGVWGLCPDACTFSTLVDAYGLTGRVSDAQRLVACAEEAGVADSRVYSAMIRFVDADEVTPLLGRLLARRLPCTTMLCNAALSTLASAGRAAEAQALVQQHMNNASASAEARPDLRTHSLLLKALCVSGDVGAAVAHLRCMYTANAHADGVKVDAAAVSIVMNASVSRSPPDMATAHRIMEEALAWGVRADVTMCNILVKGYAACSPPRPERAEAVLEQIRKLGLTPSTISICSVMDAWCELNQEAQAQRLMESGLREGYLVPSEPMFNTLIKASSRCRCKRTKGECLCEVCRCCRPDRGLELLEQMASHGLTPDTITINTLLDAFCSAGRLPQAWLLLESFLVPQLSRSAAKLARTSRLTATGGDGAADGGWAGASHPNPNPNPNPKPNDGWAGARSIVSSIRGTQSDVIREAYVSGSKTQSDVISIRGRRPARGGRQVGSTEPNAATTSPFKPSLATFATLFRHMLRYLTGKARLEARALPSSLTVASAAEPPTSMCAGAAILVLTPR